MIIPAHSCEIFAAKCWFWCFIKQLVDSCVPGRWIPLKNKHEAVWDAEGPRWRSAPSWWARCEPHCSLSGEELQLGGVVRKNYLQVYLFFPHILLKAFPRFSQKMVKHRGGMKTQQKVSIKQTLSGSLFYKKSKCCLNICSKPGTLQIFSHIPCR